MEMAHRSSDRAETCHGKKAKLGVKRGKIHYEKKRESIY